MLTMAARAAGRSSFGGLALYVLDGLPCHGSSYWVSPLAVEKAQELVSFGSPKVVITDLLSGTQYAPGKFEPLVADERRNQPG